MDAAFKRGKRLGRYRIERLLGRGGMGEVYAASDTVLARRVALKVLKGGGEFVRSRLLREARAAAALAHPGIVEIFDVGEENGVGFIAMELARGRPLRTYVGATDTSAATKIRWLVDIALALDAAHNTGLVHRDVKPDNVIVTAEGSIKVLDFGIAKRAHDATLPAGPVSLRGPRSYRTAEGHIQGTVAYMPPEQLAGKPVDARSDQFAWGVVAYELLTGAHPQGESDAPLAWLESGDADVRLLAAGGITGDVAEVILRAVEPNPKHRFARMADIADALTPHAAPRVSHLPQAPDARISAALEESEPDATPPFVLEVRASDRFGRPNARRAAGAMLVFLGALSFVEEIWRGSPLQTVVFVVSMSILALLPLSRIERAPRPGRLRGGGDGVRLERSFALPRPIHADRVIGISAEAESVFVAADRLLDTPVLVRGLDAEGVIATLRALGADQPLRGRLRWPIGRSRNDTIVFLLGVVWRLLAILVVYLQTKQGLQPVSLASGGFFMAVGLVALAFGWGFPAEGPHIELSERALHVREAKREPLEIPLDTIADVEAPPGALVVKSEAGAVHTIRVRSVVVGSRGMNDEERVLVAAHVLAAARRARAHGSSSD
jgi:serine/threonine-protein kinase